MRPGAFIFRNCASPQTIFIRNMRDLVDDPEDFGSCVDPVELLSHQRRVQTIIRVVEHGSNGFAQRLRGGLVSRKIDPDARPCDTRVHVGFVFGQPRRDKGNSKAHRPVDAAITTVSDKYVDLRQHPFERQIAGEARVAGNRAMYGVYWTAACGDDHKQIRLVRERRQRRGDQEAEIVICQSSLRYQDNLARPAQFICPGRERGLIWNDRKGTDEMHRGRDVASKLETVNCI